MTAEAKLTALVAEAHEQAHKDHCTDCTTTTVCGAHNSPEIEEAGWDAVAERMERWGESGYEGSWQDACYDAEAVA